MRGSDVLSGEGETKSAILMSVFFIMYNSMFMLSAYGSDFCRRFLLF